MKLERVTTTGDSVSAAVIKGLLEAASIPVLLRAYGAAGWLFPGTPGSLGAMDVLVPEERLAEAQRLLADAEKAELMRGDTAAVEAAAGDAGEAAGNAAGPDAAETPGEDE